MKVMRFPTGPNSFRTYRAHVYGQRFALLWYKMWYAAAANLKGSMKIMRIIGLFG